MKLEIRSEVPYSVQGAGARSDSRSLCMWESQDKTVQTVQEQA